MTHLFFGECYERSGASGDHSTEIQRWRRYAGLARRLVTAARDVRYLPECLLFASLRYKDLGRRSLSSRPFGPFGILMWWENLGAFSC